MRHQEPAVPPAEKADSPTPKQADSVKFHYIKGNDFRVIHVDGALGGPTPQGLIHIAVFSERFPIPLQSVHQREDDHFSREPSEIVARDGIVREVEADLMVSANVAKRLVDWLVEAIEKVEELKKQKKLEP